MKSCNSQKSHSSKKKRFKKAFSLPEVIVAISVLVLSIVSSTQLLVSIIRSNNGNVNTLIAFELAQEGLEGMRNIRDSNWLLAADFNGAISNEKVWGELLPSVPGTSAFYALDYHHFGNDVQLLNNIQSAEIAQYAPWKLALLLSSNGDTPDIESARLFKHKDQLVQGSEQIRYLHEHSADDEKSIFSRYLKVEALGYEGNTHANDHKVYRYRVSSVVGWNENGHNREVRLTTELSNWKGGPL